MQTDTTISHDLKRIVRQYKPRRWAFYDRQTGTMAIAGRPVHIVKGSTEAPIVQLLNFADGADIRTLYITGGRTARDVPGHDPKDEKAVERFWTAPLAHGWSIRSFRRDPWHVTYAKSEKTVDVSMSATWYGAEHDAKACADAHTLLSAVIRNTFDRGATLMGTPGRTGADLLQRSLPAGATYPALPDTVHTILAHEFGQGRMEQPGFYPAKSCQGVYVLDARLMYATACRHLPIGPVTRNKRNPLYEGYRRGIYRVNTRIPDGWAHIGLVPQWSVAEQRTVFPRTPGLFLENCWLTGPELAVLFEYGWPVSVQESILYQPDDAPGNDPARVWIDGLRELRAWAEINSELCSQASRRLIINAIGYVYRSNRVEIRWAPIGKEAEVPRDALMVLPLNQGTRYSVLAPLDSATAALYRPEWAVQVWGSCRAKLTRQALKLPARDILWLRHDSLVLPYDPGWNDTGKPGQWRVKKSVTHECDAPLTEEAYRTLMQEEAE